MNSIMSVLMIIQTLIAILVRVADLIAEYRQRHEEGTVEGVGSLSARVDTIVRRQDERTDLRYLPKLDANHIRRRDALRDMELAGIRLKERDRRLLLEAALLRAEMNGAELERIS